MVPRFGEFCYHFCLRLPENLSQPRDRFLAHHCTVSETSFSSRYAEQVRDGAEEEGAAASPGGGWRAGEGEGGGRQGGAGRAVAVRPGRKQEAAGTARRRCDDGFRRGGLQECETIPLLQSQGAHADISTSFELIKVAQSK